MAINLKRTTEASVSGVKLLVYGQAGAGKTRLVPTLPKPILLSAESGLLSLQGEDIPYITIGTMADLHEAYSWLTESEEAQQYESVALDSLSERPNQRGHLILHLAVRLPRVFRNAFLR